MLHHGVTLPLPPSDIESGFGVKVDPISGRREKNYTRQTHEVQVENIRGKEDAVSLDTAGFQFYTSPTKYKGEFLDDEEVKREYYPDSEERLRGLEKTSPLITICISRSFPFTIYSIN